MELSTKEYKQGLSKRESFLISSLAREDKTIFDIEDTKRISLSSIQIRKGFNRLEG